MLESVEERPFRAALSEFSKRALALVELERSGRVPKGRLIVAQHRAALSGAERMLGCVPEQTRVPLGTIEFYVSQL